MKLLNIRRSDYAPMKSETVRCEIVLTQRDYDQLRAHLLRDPQQEQHAIAFAESLRSGQTLRLIVRELQFDKPEHLIEQSGALVEADPVRVLDATDHCRETGFGMIALHSHPGCSYGVRKSGLDRDSEMEIFPWLAEHVAGACHASLVFGSESVDGHYWDPSAPGRRPVSCLRVVGPRLEIVPITSAQGSAEALDSSLEERFDRQVRAFGKAGQLRIASARVSIIGAGGLGTPLAQQLAYLGVRDFVVVDDDVVESTNLNRLVGATPNDAVAGTSKVEVVARLVRSICPSSRVQAIRTSVTEPTAQQELKGCDVLFGCTDSDGARLVGNEIAVRYLIPYWDLGSGIVQEEGRLQAAGGQVWQVVPGGFCLYCTGAIDIHRAQVDLMTGVERSRYLGRGYGTEETAPSVIFLNTLIASLAVQEFLNLLAPFKRPSPMLAYDALLGRVESVIPPAPDPRCPVCSPQALLSELPAAEMPEELVRSVPMAGLG